MITITKISDMRCEITKYKSQGKTIGFVPTMGYLHEGHLSLIRQAAAENDAVVVSIFVNPIQFCPGEDFEKYPRDIVRDSLLAESAGTNIIFAPEVGEMYPQGLIGSPSGNSIGGPSGNPIGSSNGNSIGSPGGNPIGSPSGNSIGSHAGDSKKGFSTYVEVGAEMTDRLCGRSRPGHFRGVTTVLTKLFNIVMPDKAYFGQKDAQQAAVVQKMVRDLDFGLEIIVCPIVREQDGLAMSSRNIYLSAEERKKALVLSRSLEKARQMVNGGERDARRIKEEITTMINNESGALIDYVETVNADTLEEIQVINGRVLVALAVRIGRTRLIDNTVLEVQTCC